MFCKSFLEAHIFLQCTPKDLCSHMCTILGVSKVPHTFTFVWPLGKKKKIRKNTPPQFTKYTKLLKIDKYVNLNPYFGFMYLTQSLKTIKEHESCIFMRDLHRKNADFCCVCGSIFVSLCCLCCVHTTRRRCFSLFILVWPRMLMI